MSNGASPAAASGSEEVGVREATRGPAGSAIPPAFTVPDKPQGPSAFHGAHDFSISGGTFNVAGRDVVYVSNVYNTYISEQDILDSQLLDVLPSNTYRIIQADNLQKRTAGTGEWFLQCAEFICWLNEPPSKDEGQVNRKRILWVIGIPGAGKTILASLVIHELEKLADSCTDISVAYVYCRYTEATSVADILIALVRQQLERHPSLASLVQGMFLRHRREKTRPSQDQLLTLLQSFTKQFRRTFYGFDGLDEAPARLQFEIVHTLSSVDVDLFVTSRPLKQIEKALKGAMIMEVRARAEDIALLIEDRLAKDPGFAELIEQHGVSEEVSQNIQEKSGGMFLHASLQIEALRGCLSIRELRERMQLFPADVKDIYCSSVDRINLLPPEQAQLVKQALIWLLYATDSLTLADLQYALAFDPETNRFDPDGIISETRLLPLFLGLITVDQESNFVRLVHYTAHEVLKSLLESEYPHPHVALATTCIARLRSCNFPASRIRIDAELAETFAAHPLLKYAHSKWGGHARQCIDQPGMNDMVIRFIEDCTSFPVSFVAADFAGSEDEEDDEDSSVDNSSDGLGYGGDENDWDDLYEDLLDILSPLHVAAYYGFPEYLAWARDDKGGDAVSLDVNVRTSEGFKPLTFACAQEQPEIVRALLASPGIEVNAIDCCSAVVHAATTSLDIVDILLDVPDIEFNPDDELMIAALTEAMRVGNHDALKLLLENRDTPSWQSNDLTE